MSRIGKKEIAIPDKTEVSINAGVISVKGPKGSLERNFHPDISMTVADKNLSVSVNKKSKQSAALWGTWASHAKNMITGVNQGFEKKLVLEGVGYKSQVNGDKLVLELGFSHSVNVKIPSGLAVKAEKNIVTISGADKELVGSFSAQIRALKKPEPYKGKGFHYEGEVIRRKQGKKNV